MSSYGSFTKLATRIANSYRAIHSFRAWGFFAYYNDEGIVVVRSFTNFIDMGNMK